MVTPVEVEGRRVDPACSVEAHAPSVFGLEYREDQWEGTQLQWVDWWGPSM
jgi:hypothetical protein